MENYKDKEEENINEIMKIEMKKVEFIKLGIMIDLWRWEVLRGKKKE